MKQFFFEADDGVYTIYTYKKNYKPYEYIDGECIILNPYLIVLEVPFENGYYTKEQALEYVTKECDRLNKVIV